MYNPEEVVEIWKMDIEAAERRATEKVQALEIEGTPDVRRCSGHGARVLAEGSRPAPGQTDRRSDQQGAGLLIAGMA
jgi:hypothetical protein